MTSDPAPLLLYIAVAAFIGVIGSSMAIAVCIRYVAHRMEVAIGLRPAQLVGVCGLARVVTMTLGGLALGSVGGIPAGSLFGPPLAFLAVLYALPLGVGAVEVGAVITRSSIEGSPYQVGVLSGVIFSLGHVLAVPVAWAIVIAIGRIF